MSKNIKRYVRQYLNNPKLQKQDKMYINWIDLDIDNLPDRFLTRDDIEMECQQEGSWAWYPTDTCNKAYAVRNINDGYKYRYRIKPLESIRTCSNCKYEKMPNYCKALENKHCIRWNNNEDVLSVKDHWQPKQVESIRITREMWKLYCNHWGLNVAYLEVDNRPVEIID